MKRLQITEKGETRKIIRMFAVNELNNIEEDKENKVKVLSCKILVAIPDKPGSKKVKTYLVLLDSETTSYLMDKNITSIHGLDENVTPIKEKWLTQCGVFKTKVKVTLEQMKLPQFTTKRTVTAEMNMFKKRRKTLTTLF